MDQITLYWAAPCFTQAERIWNRLCVESLRKKGYNVILPQDEANKFFVDDVLDFDALAENCYSQAIASDVVVAVLDGPDPDSGMSMEVGFKIRDIELKMSNPRVLVKGAAIGVRTDFRVSEDGQLNAMFRLLDDVILFPSFNESYEELCDKIDESIKRLLKNERRA